MNTELFIDIPQKSFNLKTLIINDASNYCEDEKITNYLIEVLPVNKDSWVTFHVKKDFRLILNSSNLGYVKVSNIDQLLDLPDGIYEIRQSYKPNIHTLSHYYHLRTVAIDLKYAELLCSHFSEECKKTDRMFIEEGKHLNKIRQYIDAAIYATSEKHDKEMGIRFYNQAVELIKQYENECACM